jgi:nicotinate-nucleotide adenylyltransferase
VGVFGGAFDPPHRAHRVLAEAALSELGLDVLHVLPTGNAWHKPRPLTAFDHRLAMCQLAFGDLAGVRLDSREALRDGPTYTVDTLEELVDEYPGATLFLVIGADQFGAFTSWKRWRDVLLAARLVVAERVLPGGDTSQKLVDQGPTGTSVEIPFEHLHTPLLDISATALRALLASGHPGPQALAHLVPDAVASYISQHSLYQKPS